MSRNTERTCTFNWPMVDFLQNKDELLDGTILKSTKKERETWKVQCGSKQWKL